MSLCCGLRPAAAAASAPRAGGGAVGRHQGTAGGAAAGGRPAGGVAGPDAPHPPSPAGGVQPVHRDAAHTHPGLHLTHDDTPKFGCFLVCPQLNFVV